MSKRSLEINSYKILFWDFDGVIKESINVKTEAYVKLFENFGKELTDRVRRHHLSNGGMSRFEKIPLYANWAGLDLNKSHLNDFLDRFSKYTYQLVLNSDWVPGVENLIRTNKYNQIYIVVSATPEEELGNILQSLNLTSCFLGCYGSPMAKSQAISECIKDYQVSPSDCLMIGDAKADLDAAKANEIDFLLRLHSFNRDVFSEYTGFIIEDFLNL
ncbi:HAD hydrolase-like protein [Leptospira levettii]|uniref:HAD family hydrolase n=1 Tax=Leptospira levettii TaxID=2023178 RepID=UPI00223E3C61|nr:HAD hydrolase-like protein [Leptospira levettii]MCW7497028.1 HAD hydrolase-like protein [Leptospira levettii]